MPINVIEYNLIMTNVFSVIIDILPSLFCWNVYTMYIHRAYIYYYLYCIALIGIKFFRSIGSIKSSIALLYERGKALGKEKLRA